MIRNTEKPVPDTAPEVHKEVLRLFESEQRGRILDMGAGEGALSYALKRLGFEVYACDIVNKLKVGGIPYTHWDLNSREKPYDEKFFDYIACIEVLEHLENPSRLVRQIKRILKPSGKLILSTPNILSIDSRISFLMSGYFSFFGKQIKEHINPIPFWELERILEGNGFVTEVIATNRLTKMFRSLRPLISLLGKPEVVLGGEILIIKARLK